MGSLYIGSFPVCTVAPRTLSPHVRAPVGRLRSSPLQPHMQTPYAPYLTREPSSMRTVSLSRSCYRNWHFKATYYIFALTSIHGTQASSCHTDLRGRRQCGLSTTARAGIAIAVAVTVLAIFLLRHLRVRSDARARSTPTTDLESIVPTLGHTPSYNIANNQWPERTSVPQYPPPIYSPRGTGSTASPPPYAPPASASCRHPASITSSAKREQGVRQH
ncbi:hypothetical protein C8Q79DRAFT_422763 [Trametes meyenii]|nr:hypothetical protein C8Q79DRAFT_422763 [Trametes meyenii]